MVEGGGELCACGAVRVKKNVRGGENTGCLPKGGTKRTRMTSSAPFSAAMCRGACILMPVRLLMSSPELSSCSTALSATRLRVAAGLSSPASSCCCSRGLRLLLPELLRRRVGELLLLPPRLGLVTPAMPARAILMPQEICTAFSMGMSAVRTAREVARSRGEAPRAVGAKASAPSSSSARTLRTSLATVA